jgi:hypothetical protein
VPPMELAQLNIARPVAPLHTGRLDGFVALLEPVNELADAAPGFVWRLQDDTGDATSYRGFGDDSIIVNMSVWRDLESLSRFVFDGLHVQVLRRRREWFEAFGDVYAVCWWVPAGHRPDLAEAEDRLHRLRTAGPAPSAFTLHRPFGPDGAAATLPGRAGTDERSTT